MAQFYCCAAKASGSLRERRFFDLRPSSCDLHNWLDIEQWPCSTRRLLSPSTRKGLHRLSDYYLSQIKSRLRVLTSYQSAWGSMILKLNKLHGLDTFFLIHGVDFQASHQKQSKSEKYRGGREEYRKKDFHKQPTSCMCGWSCYDCWYVYVVTDTLSASLSSPFWQIFKNHASPFTPPILPHQSVSQGRVKVRMEKFVGVCIWVCVNHSSIFHTLNATAWLCWSRTLPFLFPGPTLFWK